MQQGSEEVKMVVRTINSSAFTAQDWEEYAVSVSWSGGLFPVVWRWIYRSPARSWTSSRPSAQ